MEEDKEAEFVRCMRSIDWTVLKRHLPTGIKFSPSETDLVDLLEDKSSGRYIFPGLVCEFNVYTCHPEDLLTKEGIAIHGEKMYIFSPLQRQHSTGKKMSRLTVKGAGWKLSGSSQPLRNGRASKSSLAYNLKSGSVKTNWLMHEYRLADRGNNGHILENLALCVVYNTDRTKKENDETINGGGGKNQQGRSSGSPDGQSSDRNPEPTDLGHGQAQRHVTQLVNGSSSSASRHQLQLENRIVPVLEDRNRSVINHQVQLQTRYREHESSNGLSVSPQMMINGSSSPVSRHQLQLENQIENRIVPVLEDRNRSVINQQVQLQNQYRGGQPSNGFSVSPHVIQTQMINGSSSTSVSPEFQNQAQMIDWSIPVYYDPVQQFSDHDPGLWGYHGWPLNSLQPFPGETYPDAEIIPTAGGHGWEQEQRTDFGRTGSIDFGRTDSTDFGGNGSASEYLNDVLTECRCMNEQQQHQS